ncbi:MAG: phospholipase D-like domain-containing protein [Elusimicrobiota bacterium]
MNKNKFIIAVIIAALGSMAWAGGVEEAPDFAGAGLDGTPRATIQIAPFPDLSAGLAGINAGAALPSSVFETPQKAAMPALITATAAQSFAKKTTARKKQKQGSKSASRGTLSLKKSLNAAAQSEKKILSSDAGADGQAAGAAAAFDGSQSQPSDGIPTGTFDPRIKWSLLTSWSQAAIGPSLMSDIEHPASRQVDAAEFDFTNFRVGDKKIYDVLQTLKRRPGSRLRVVSGYDQAMHNNNSLWPQIKSLADDAHLLSGIGQVPAPDNGQARPTDRQGLMHVKLWIIRREDGSRIIYVGSANASNAALGGMPRNHEIMFKLEIPGDIAQSPLVDHFTSAFEDLLARAKSFEARRDP